jgi:hypothetical protein
MKIYSTKSGVSLLIGIVMVTILLLFGMTVSGMVVESIRQSVSVNRANQAFYAAEGALEEGLYQNVTLGAGFTGEVTESNIRLDASGAPCTENSTDPACDYPATASYQIGGQVPVGLRYNPPYGEYGIPTPGTGTVGTNCDPLEADIDTSAPYFFISTTKEPNFLISNLTSITDYQRLTTDPKENPCNWNKLKVGDSVSIPLYYTTYPEGPDSEGIPTNVFTSGTSFSLRMRTACKNGMVYCPSADRYVLNTDPLHSDNVYKGNDPIVAWQVTGVNSEGKQETLEGKTNTDENGLDVQNSTIIHEIKINTSTNFVVLESSNPLFYKGIDLNGKEGNIQNFILGAVEPDWSERGILDKPTLKLSVIHSLLSDDGETNVPYLEYQVLSSTNLTTPPADTVQTIRAEGYSGEFKQVLEVKQPQESGLLEYVIQQ